MKAEKEKKAKKQKTFPAKKLPGLFKKAYTKDALEKKILKKVYIPEDRQLIAALFSENVTKGKKKPRTLVVVPKTRVFTKPELKQLKGIAASIKKNKARFKAVPFIALVVFVSAAGIFITLFKNPLAKRALRSGMEQVFSARCDVGSVSVSFFDAHISVHSLSQADKNHPMKNLFSFETLDVDFNLTQLLRGRFNAQNLEIAGVAWGTARTVSGELSPKEKKQRAKKALRAKKEKPETENAFLSALQGKNAASLSALTGSLEQAFSGYDPRAVLKKMQDSMRTEKAAEDVAAEVQALREKWKNTPDELKTQVSSFKDSVESLAALRPEDVKTPSEIAAALKNINEAVSSGKKLKKTVTETVSAVESDRRKVQKLSDSLSAAISHDKKLVSSQVNLYTSLSLDDGKRLLSGALDSAAYEALGAYYPYLQKAVSYAASMKKHTSPEAKREAAAKKAAGKQAAQEKLRRQSGRDVYWRKERTPSLLIEHALASGAGLQVEATGISNDMNMYGSPLQVWGSYAPEKGPGHNVSLTVDTRYDSTASLIEAGYNGAGCPISVTQLSDAVSAGGIPSFTGRGDVSLSLAAEENGAFALSGSVSCNPVTITATPLSMERIDALYQKVLASVTEMQVTGTASFAPETGIRLSLSSDADSRFAAALKKALSQEASALQKELSAMVQAELEARSGSALSEIAGFEELAIRIGAEGLSVDSALSVLNEKKAELSGSVTDKAKKAAEEKVKAEAQAAAERAKKEAEEKAAEAAKKAASNLLKGKLKF